MSVFVRFLNKKKGFFRNKKKKIGWYRDETDPNLLQTIIWFEVVNLNISQYNQYWIAFFSGKEPWLK